MSLELVMQLMNKLKIILQSNYVIISILILVILITILRINLPVKTTYNLNTTKVTGILLSSKIEEEKVTKLSELVDHEKKNQSQTTLNQENNEHGAGNVAAFIISLIIVGILILGMLVPDFLG